jgi:nicotinate-nucleotide adenylyltransferase
MAQHARATLGLDRVIFSVAPRPPHKRSDTTSPLEHRREMVRIAIAGDEGLAVTRIEETQDLSYTVDLLGRCRTLTRADLYFILGADSLAEFATWKAPQEILRLVTLVVFARGDTPLVLDVPGPAALVVFESPRIDVSSSELRHHLATSGAAPEWLAPAVASYALEHGLYRAHGRDGERADRA